jgi:DNA mismatch endonuclease (patch repair protein)
MRRVADVVFRRAQVAVYVDGCFWHGCPVHATWPKANADWWKDKLQSNQRRDASTDRALADAGWVAVRVWEHEDACDVAQRVDALVRARVADLRRGTDGPRSSRRDARSNARHR